ncbi:MAG: class B sortase [Eubacteriales bacterium]|nr:class B sortase [Eubacteriales bacterium]
MTCDPDKISHLDYGNFGAKPTCTPTPTPTPKPTCTPTPAPKQSSAPAEVLPGFEALLAENGDVVGWVSIPGTAVDYPVMQTKDDPFFYLHRDFSKNRRYSGLPFLDARCALGQPDEVYLIYGHNMKNGTMFGTLLDYRQEGYWREHPAVRFDTLHASGEYAVMAVMVTKANQGGDAAFAYDRQVALPTREAYEDFVRQVKAAALYETGVTAAFGERLLLLSTCCATQEQGRLVVVAKRVNN